MHEIHVYEIHTYVCIQCHSGPAQLQHIYFFFGIWQPFSFQPFFFLLFLDPIKHPYFAHFNGSIYVSVYDVIVYEYKKGNYEHPHLHMCSCIFVW